MVTNQSTISLLDILGIAITIVITLLTFAFVFAPWILATMFTKNRRMWLWWYRNKWKGTLMISLIVAACRVPIILSVVNLKHSEFVILACPDIMGALLISSMHFSPETVPPDRWQFFGLLILEMLIVFCLFSVLKRSKTYFAKRAYEIE